jgi:hypothetical protein
VPTPAYGRYVPQRLSFTIILMDAAARAIAGIVLLDEEGHEVRLGDLWDERPVVLTWLRHYG